MCLRILGNLLTMDYYWGFGFTGLSYSEKNVTTNNPSGNSSLNYYTDGTSTSNFHGFIRMPSNLGLSFTGGFRIGYIIPQKTRSTRPNNTTSSN
jgi:hypothetical protein